LAKPALDVLNKAVALFEAGIESSSVHLSENMVGFSHCFGTVDDAR
jgi:hypothetical protein